MLCWLQSSWSICIQLKDIKEILLSIDCCSKKTIQKVNSSTPESMKQKQKCNSLFTAFKVFFFSPFAARIAAAEHFPSKMYGLILSTLNFNFLSHHLEQTAPDVSKTRLQKRMFSELPDSVGAKLIQNAIEPKYSWAKTWLSWSTIEPKHNWAKTKFSQNTIELKSRCSWCQRNGHSAESSLEVLNTLFLDGVQLRISMIFMHWMF